MGRGGPAIPAVLTSLRETEVGRVITLASPQEEGGGGEEVVERGEGGPGPP